MSKKNSTLPLQIDKRMEDSLLTAIAIGFPFTYPEIKHVYDITKSIDLTLRICQLAAQSGLSSPVMLSDHIHNSMVTKLRVR